MCSGWGRKCSQVEELVRPLMRRSDLQPARKHCKSHITDLFLCFQESMKPQPRAPFPNNHGQCL